MLHNYKVYALVNNGVHVSVSQFANRIYPARGPITAARILLPANVKNVRIVSQRDVFGDHFASQTPSTPSTILVKSYVQLVDEAGKFSFVGFDLNKA